MANHLLFVGSSADANQPGIHAFGLDADTGALEPRATYAGIANPSFLAVHPNRAWLYAVSELNDGSVCAFRFDAESGALEPINQQPSGGGAPCHLALDVVSGGWLVVSNYNSGTVGVLPITDGGALGEPTHLVHHHGGGTHPKRQEGPHAHSATFAPDGRFVLVADLGIDQIVVYAFDAATGSLWRTHLRPRPARGGTASPRVSPGPRHPLRG